MQAAFVSRLCSNPWPSQRVHRVTAGAGGGSLNYLLLGQEISDFICQPGSTFTKLFFFPRWTYLQKPIPLPLTCFQWKRVACTSPQLPERIRSAHPQPAHPRQHPVLAHVPAQQGTWYVQRFTPLRELLVLSLTMPLSNPVCKWYSHSGMASTYAIRIGSTASFRCTCITA